MPEAKFELRMEKLIAAAAYLVNASEHDPRFDETKLISCLYHADCTAYVQTGAPITGATYLRQPGGPYPQDWKYAKGAMDLFPELLLVLSQPEQNLLNAQLVRFAQCDAKAMLDRIHQEFAWISTPPGQPISYELAGLSDAPITAERLATARQIAADAASRRTAR